jgi:cytochrome c biogenesis protein CcmG/thiol:disulfide interchange protein DsbE
VSTHQKKKVGLYVALAGLLLFTGLMIYALNRDANYVPSPLVGRTAPSFVASTAQGSSIDLSAIAGKGQWVVINFWNTTCVVCRVEAPEMERFWREDASKPDSAIRFVSVNIQDDVAAILGYQRDFALSYPVVADRDGKISLDYGVYGTPETFFVSPDGVVRHRVAGEVDRNTILAFVDWLNKNPAITPQQAIEGFGRVRAGAPRGG